MGGGGGDNDDGEKGEKGEGGACGGSGAERRGAGRRARRNGRAAFYRLPAVAARPGPPRGEEPLRAGPGRAGLRAPGGGGGAGGKGATAGRGGTRKGREGCEPRGGQGVRRAAAPPVPRCAPSPNPIPPPHTPFPIAHPVTPLPSP